VADRAHGPVLRSPGDCPDRSNISAAVTISALCPSPDEGEEQGGTMTAPNPAAASGVDVAPPDAVAPLSIVPALRESGPLPPHCVDQNRHATKRAPVTTR
jgi:hypothetical protein